MWDLHIVLSPVRDLELQELNTRQMVSRIKTKKYEDVIGGLEVNGAIAFQQTSFLLFSVILTRRGMCHVVCSFWCLPLVLALTLNQHPACSVRKEGLWIACVWDEFSLSLVCQFVGGVLDSKILTLIPILFCYFVVRLDPEVTAVPAFPITRQS